MQGRLSAGPAPTAPDGIDLTAAAEAQALDGWRQVTDPLLGPLLLAASRATSFDEALAAIAARGPDGSELLERLATATAIARGVGDAVD